MPTLPIARDSDEFILAAIQQKPSARVGESYVMVVYQPPQVKLVNDSQEFGLVPYAEGNYALPRVSQEFALLVYSTYLPNERRSRCWSFSLDGHTFYVLDLGPEGTWCYDLDTRKWCKFRTNTYDMWNMRSGTMWQQIRIVAGDSSSSIVWELDPNQPMDEEWRDLHRVVTGGLATRSRVYYPVEAVRLTGSVGAISTETGATISLRFSDDNGQTWSDYFTIDLIEGDTFQEISWRSLGSFMAPGRVFEISDVGGIVRIDGCDGFIANFDDDGSGGSKGDG